MTKHESADAICHCQAERPTDASVAPAAVSVQFERQPPAGPKKDGKRRARRSLDLRLGRGDGRHEHCCIITSVHDRSGRCYRVDDDSEQLASATGAAWKIGEVPTVVVDHEGVGDAHRSVGVGAIARSEPPRPHRRTSDEALSLRCHPGDTSGVTDLGAPIWPLPLMPGIYGFTLQESTAQCCDVLQLSPLAWAGRRAAVF